METELIEIHDFLAAQPPFDHLSEQQLNELSEHIQIRYFRRGTAFPPQPDEDAFYILRSGAVELRNAQGKLSEKLAEGDYFATDCLLLDTQDIPDGEVIEDSLVYQMPCPMLHQLGKQCAAFKNQLGTSLRQRLQQAAVEIQKSDNDSLNVEIGSLITRPAVTLDSQQSIQQAALIMSQHMVSSVLVTRNGKLLGLLTDRDIRKRCVAAGLDSQQAVHHIMTPKPHTIQHDELALDAMLTMTQQHFHHLPVMNNGQLMGMLSSTDLARLNNSNSALLTADIRKARSKDDLVNAALRLPGLQQQLAQSSATAQHIGEIISRISDAITTRLIEMAIDELGPAPVAFVWLCAGSQARYEQSSHSDQDNALLISDQMSRTDGHWFEQLATRVCDGLHDCGFVYCPGNAMSSNLQWRQTQTVWRGYFQKWIETPDPKALMLSSIFFDLRPLYGKAELYHQIHQDFLQKTHHNSLFIAYMVANALNHRPPLGFFRDFVLMHDNEHQDVFDIKHRGIVPITDMARIFALAEGIHDINTHARLQATSGTPSISREMSDNLQDALKLIAGLRINHQAAQIAKGEPADNYLSPTRLSQLERKHLKDAFKVIQSMQETLENRYQPGRLG